MKNLDHKKVIVEISKALEESIHSYKNVLKLQKNSGIISESEYRRRVNEFKPVEEGLLATPEFWEQELREYVGEPFAGGTISDISYLSAEDAPGGYADDSDNGPVVAIYITRDSNSRDRYPHKQVENVIYYWLSTDNWHYDGLERQIGYYERKILDDIESKITGRNGRLR